MFHKNYFISNIILTDKENVVSKIFDTNNKEDVFRKHGRPENYKTPVG